MSVNYYKENVIEFFEGAEQATVYLTWGKYINKVKKLAQEYPDDVQITDENKDGSIVAHMPLKWAIKMSKTRQVTEEQKMLASERFKKMHNN